MPNANRPSGFTPVKTLTGADWDGRGNWYHIDSTISNALYVGDPVKLVAGLDTAYGLPSIDLAAAGNTPVGVILAIGDSPVGGPLIDRSDLSKVFAPATKTKDYYALVCDDPNVIFEIQEDAVGGSMTYAKANSNASWINATPATGVVLSATMLDSSTATTTNTLGLAIMGLVQRADNALGSATYPYAKWLVKFNVHALAPGRTGV